MAGIVTLYIEDADIKLLVTRGKQVEKWARLLLEPGLVRDGVILDETQVADRIKELFELQKVRAKRVIVGLSGLNSIFRVISLPELPQAILHEAVRNEARRVIPLPLEEVYLSYQPIPAPAEETRIFLVAFPRNSTDALIKTLRMAGLNPYMMDLAPLALCRSVTAPRAIIINVWSTNLDIAVMADRIPQVIRSLSLPSDAVSLKDKLPTVIEELNRTVAFYNSSHKEQPLDSSVPVFVCGDLAETLGERESLTGKLDYSVSPLPSPLKSPELFDSNQFMVNIGLALKELLPKRGEADYSLVNFNALPEIYRPPAVQLSRILTPVGIIVAIGALAYGGLFVQDEFEQTAALRSQLAPIESDIAEWSGLVTALQEQVGPLEAQIQPIEATSGALNATLASLEQGRDQADRDVSMVVSRLPANVDLTQVNYGGDSITVRGVAPDEDYIFSYARALRSSGRFPTVIILSITEGSRAEGDEESKVYSFVFLLK